jgi:hypothetical protein
MHLIYVNEIGADFKGQRQYEFIFSTSDEIEMDVWFTVPASMSSESKSPDLVYVDAVGLLKGADIIFELVQNSDYFGVIDAVDGIVALAWEKSNYDSEEERLYFRFGESSESVAKKLKERGLFLIKQDIN